MGTATRSRHQPDHVVAKNEGGGSFLPHPFGQFAARCVDVIDLGEKVEQYEGKPPKLSHKVALVFRTGEVNAETGEITDIAKEFTLSMYETANLRKFLEQWRGKGFTEAEIEEGAPLHKLCGVSALLNVEHKKSGAGRVYANINAIQKLPKVMEPGCPIGDDYDRPEYLVTRKGAYAAEAAEYRKRIGAPTAASTTPDGFEEFPAAIDEGDDLPFKVGARSSGLAAPLLAKACFKCEATLPLSEFYRHPRMGDGHLGKCKECTKHDVRQNRTARRDYYVSYDRERSRVPSRVRAITASRTPEKRRASVAVHNAVNRGQLRKLPCEMCGHAKSEAHHTDYSRPLDVIWLCRKHHADWHRANDMSAAVA